jgi:hypothetical protein
LLPAGILKTKKSLHPSCLGAEELRSKREVGLGQLVSHLEPVQINAGPRATELVSQPHGMIDRNDGIVAAGNQADMLAREIRQVVRLEHNHGAQQHGPGKNFRAQKEQGSGNIRAIGIAQCGQMAGRETIFGAGSDDEVGERVRAPRDVFQVEYSLREAAKETRQPLFIDVPARAKEGRTRRQLATQWEQVVFVAAGAMKEKYGRRAGLGTRFETVNVGEVIHGWELSLES